MLEVLHGERFETLALNLMTLLTIGLGRFPLDLTYYYHWSNSHSVQISLKSSLDLCRIVTQWCAKGTSSSTVISVKYLDFRHMLQSSKEK